MNEGSDGFAGEHPDHIFRIRQCKYNDRQAVVHSETGRGRIHYLQSAGQYLVIADLIKANSARILSGVGRINAVNILGKQNGVGADFRRTQSRCCIC